MLSPSIDPKQFRTVMGRFASGVTIVGYVRDSEPTGLTATAFISVSLNPPLVLVSIRSESRFLASVSVGTPFCISFLSHEQHPISDHFGGRPNDPGLAPFEVWQGVPAVTDAVAALAVRAVDIYPAGDHQLVIAEVEHMFHTERTPLLFFGGRYQRLALDVLGRELADEMTIGLMPVYDTLERPLHRAAAGLQLFLRRGAVDPVWGGFISHTDHLATDTVLTRNISSDLERGRELGDFRFSSTEIATDFLMGAVKGGIQRFARDGTSMALVFELTSIILRGLGADEARVETAVRQIDAHLRKSAPGVLPWWQDFSDSAPHMTALSDVLGGKPGSHRGAARPATTFSASAR